MQVLWPYIMSYLIRFSSQLFLSRKLDKKIRLLSCIETEKFSLQNLSRNIYLFGVAIELQIRWLRS